MIREQAYYCVKIRDNSHNPKPLLTFSTINKLLQMNSDHLHPSSTDDSALANTFADFFAKKISKLRNSIQGTKSSLGALSLSPVTYTACLSSFSQVDYSVVHKLLTGLKKKHSCSLHRSHLPTCVLMECSDTLLPTFTMVINCSLSHGVILDSLKTAILLPLLKKKNADHKFCSNFRPISNLKLISKLIEKAVASQLTSQITN